MQNGTSGVVEDRHMSEDQTGDRVLVHRRAVKRKSQAEYMHSLYAGEKVGFAKALDPQGFWAVGVTWLSNHVRELYSILFRFPSNQEIAPWWAT